jgi:hypothetical protein
MNRLMIIAATGLLAGSLQAAAPGIIDGQNIPSDYANSKRVGVQTNYTGVGDVTSLDVVSAFSEGTELDALYLAVDNQYLYVGLAGNSLPIGNPFVILIDSDFDFGQTELRTEGVGGPPFMLQIAGREVVLSDNGTPNDPNDDTYTVTPNSGTLLPDCGLGGSFTGWDFALAIDEADDGNMYVHEYLLFDPTDFPVGFASPQDVCNYADGRGRVSCDPTPANPNDSDLPLYAIRQLAAVSEVGDGNENFEGGTPQLGYPRGGMDNSNTAGVTDTDASGAATATTGVEIAIPLSNIGPGGVFDFDTIRMLVLTIDGDEYQSSSVTDGYGTFINQALPSYTGAACNPPASLGLRPDLSVVASCFEVDLSTLSGIAPSAVLDGVIVPSDYHSGAPLLTQSCPTSGGDQAQLPDQELPGQDGSELNELYVDNDDQYVYIGLSGNLQADNAAVSLFFDTDGNPSGGDVTITDFSNFNLDGTYQRWDPNDPNTFVPPVITSGPDGYRVQATDFGGGFSDISPNIDAPAATHLILDVEIHPGNIADTIRILLADADGTERIYDFLVPGTGVFTLTRALDSYDFDISPGSVPGLDLSDLSFFHIAGGFNNGNPGNAFDVTFDNLALSDSDEGAHVLNFEPGPSGFTSRQISGFSNISLVGTYVGYDTATFTSGPTSFTVDGPGGFGGGVFDVNPNVDVTGAVSLELDITINPASSFGGSVYVVLADGDDSQLRWTFSGLPPGSHSLSLPFSAGADVLTGSIPGFDFTNVSFCHIQSNLNPVTDLVYENLAVTVPIANVAPIVTINGTQLPNGPLDLLGNGLLIGDQPVGYDAAYSIDLSYAPQLAWINFFDLDNNTFAYRGSVVPDSGDALLFDDPGGEVASNPNLLLASVNNRNILGVIGCDDPNLPCFSDDAPTVAALAETANTGIEMAIPLADLGLGSGDLPRVIYLSAILGDNGGAIANQTLPSIRNFSYDENQVVNPGAAPVNLTDPLSGPTAGALIEDFVNFMPAGAYGTWDPNSSFTSDPNGFTVDATDFGGCYFPINPAIDATGGAFMLLDVTFNPDNVTDRLVVVLHDDDGTEREHVFRDLSGIGRQVLIQDLNVSFNDFAAGDVSGAEPLGHHPDQRGRGVP